MLFNTLTLHSAATPVTIASSAIQCLQTTKLAVQCTYVVTTGSFTLQLQESNDGVSWADVSGGSQAVTATGNAMIKVADAVSLFYRVNIVRTSGTLDSLIILAHAKGV